MLRLARRLFLLFLLPFTFQFNLLPENETYHRAIVDYIKKHAKTWTAEVNRFVDPIEILDSFHNKTKYDILKKMQSNLVYEVYLHDTLSHMRTVLEQNLVLPRVFDPRKEHYQCWSLHQIFDQAGCGSCWAVSATSVMSDRLCIASKGKIQKQISIEDLISCCSTCGAGCQGLYDVLDPFLYWKNVGIVTGGSYGSNEGCRPYSFAPNCGSPCSVTIYNQSKTPECRKECHWLYGKSYAADLVKAKSAYWLRTPAYYSKKKTYGLLDEFVEKFNVTRDELKVILIKRDLYLHGPLFACFNIHEDFYHYRKGIYHSKDGPGINSYGHCVKLLGWGWEGGQEFWIYANTWSRRWGENGFYRIHIEDLPREIAAGLPDI